MPEALHRIEQAPRLEPRRRTGRNRIMVAVFDVPGSVRLKDVNRKPADETPSQRLHRLAQKAVIEGCQVMRVHNADKLFAVTSARDGAVVYIVDAEAGKCG